MLCFRETSDWCPFSLIYCVLQKLVICVKNIIRFCLELGLLLHKNVTEFQLLLEAYSYIFVTSNQGIFPRTHNLILL